MRNSRTETATPWRVPVRLEDIPEAGAHFALSADGDTRAAVAQVAGLRQVDRLEAEFDVVRHGAGLHVGGRVAATVGQTCVVSLEPLTNEIEEDVDLVFMPQSAPELAAAKETEGAQESLEVKGDEPEVLVDGTIDLGALATEFLILGRDPYPRRPGAVFEPPQDLTREESPFAVLAALTKAQDDD